MRRLLALSLVFGFSCSDSTPPSSAPVADPGAIEAARALLVANNLLPAGPAVHVGAESKSQLVRVRVATTADGGFELYEPVSNIGVDVRLVGAAHTAGVQVDGWTVYHEALEGRAAFVRTSSDGAEDYVVSTADRVRYRIDFNAAVAGLRLVANTLELLDAGGAPRLRMNPPYVIDGGRARHPARVELVGCDADRSSVPPFERPVVRPESRQCELIIRWSDVPGPVLVDPSWSTTAAMSVVRSEACSAPLDADRVLVVGGKTWGPVIDFHSTAEVFDAKTRTWASAGAMRTRRAQAAATALGGGRVLVAGGQHESVAALTSAEIFEATAGWHEAGPMGESRRDFGLATIGGRVLAVGDAPSAELFDVVSERWSFTSPPPTRRAGPGVHAIGPDSVFVYGGFALGDYSSTAEIWTSGKWTPAGSTSAPGGTSIRLADGRILVVGGPFPSNLAEIWSATTGWKKTTSFPGEVSWHKLTLLPSGAVLVAGGLSTDVYPPTTMVFDPVAETWAKAGELSQRRWMTIAQATRTGSLIAGGRNALGPGDYGLSSSEFFELAASGATCTASWECASGHCADGVCCDAACAGPCESCGLEGSRGSCRPVAGAPVHGTCPATVPTVCAASACDGVDGTSCRKFPGPDRVCGDAECRDGFARTASHCDGAGGCTAAPPRSCGDYACLGPTCATSCTNNEDCRPGLVCDRTVGRCRPPRVVADGGVAPDADAGTLDVDGGTIRAGCGCEVVGRAPGASWAWRLVACSVAIATARRLRTLGQRSRLSTSRTSTSSVPPRMSA